MLIAAQTLRDIGGEECRHSIVRPPQLMPARLVFGSKCGRADRQKARLTLNHDLPAGAQGWRNECDTSATTSLDAIANPFSTGTCLASASSAAKQPEPPIAVGRQLFRAGPERPELLEQLDVLVTQRV
jgi:hypothetical protein